MDYVRYSHEQCFIQIVFKTGKYYQYMNMSHLFRDFVSSRCLLYVKQNYLLLKFMWSTCFLWLFLSSSKYQRMEWMLGLANSNYNRIWIWSFSKCSENFRIFSAHEHQSFVSSCCLLSLKQIWLLIKFILNSTFFCLFFLLFFLLIS